MITLSNPLFICLAMLAAVGLVSTITWTIVGIGMLLRPVDPATNPSTVEWTPLQSLSAEDLHKLAVQRAKSDCGCRCHRETMQPGLRCLDCFGELCDEGTAE